MNEEEPLVCCSDGKARRVPFHGGELLHGGGGRRQDALLQDQGLPLVAFAGLGHTGAGAGLGLGQNWARAGPGMGWAMRGSSEAWPTIGRVSGCLLG